MDQDSATPVAPPAPPAKRAPPPRRPPTRSAHPNLTEHPLTPWAVTAAAVIVLAFVILGIIPTSLRSSRPWQAVFLTNGQVYFGHVVRQTLTTVILRDVYYLTTQGASPPGPDVNLVKLGTELHGPTDEMRINRSHMLFTERLRDDATVVRAIAAARERAVQPSTPGALPVAPGPVPGSIPPPERESPTNP